jgi:hypothetical protein
MRTTKGFRFSPKAIKYLEALAKEEGVSQTKILEDLLLKEAVKRGIEN